MTAEFWKPGTRIRIKKEPRGDVGLYNVGWIGTIIDSQVEARWPITDDPEVEFDPGFVSDRGGTNEGLGIPRLGCCRWYVEQECIEVIPDGPTDYTKYDEGGVV